MLTTSLKFIYTLCYMVYLHSPCPCPTCFVFSPFWFGCCFSRASYTGNEMIQTHTAVFPVHLASSLFKTECVKAIQKRAMSSAILCLTVRVCEVMNKADMCGNAVNNIISHLSALFACWWSESIWLGPEESWGKEDGCGSGGGGRGRGRWGGQLSTATRGKVGEGWLGGE